MPAIKQNRNESREGGEVDPFRFESPWGDLARSIRLFVSLRVRSRTHTQPGDIRGVFEGIRSYLAGWFFVLVFIVLLNASLIVGLMEFAKIDPLFCVLMAAGADFAIAVILFSLARRRLRQVFRDTSTREDVGPTS